MLDVGRWKVDAGHWNKVQRRDTSRKNVETRSIASLQKSARKAPQTLAILKGLPKKKRREVSRLYKIGAQSATNFGNPERFAKEKTD